MRALKYVLTAALVLMLVRQTTAQHAPAAESSTLESEQVVETSQQPGDSSTFEHDRHEGVTRRAYIDGTGPGWRALGEADFADVNGRPETWEWDDDLLRTTGRPIGVYRSREVFRNFELVLEWRHLQSGGNSGVFVWVPLEALADLPPDELPDYGIEVQMLDHGYHELYFERTGKRGEHFTSNGDVFAVGESELNPFPPTSPNGARSFPRKDLSKGAGEWNHYYVRAINGELRLWVNGEEVSGGNGAEPAAGHFCLEAEGARVEFRNIRIRELP